MSGMYGMICGANPATPYLLSLVGINPELCGRYRDCAILPDGENYVVVILTRNGGANREAHTAAHDYLVGQPGYLRDYDEPYDETYASYEFSWAAQSGPVFAKLEFANNLVSLAPGRLLAEQGHQEKPMARFRRLIECLNDPDSEEAKGVMERTKPLQDALESAFDSAGISGITTIEVSSTKAVVTKEAA